MDQHTHPALLQQVRPDMLCRLRMAARYCSCSRSRGTDKVSIILRRLLFQSTCCWRRLCVEEGCLFQMMERFSLVFNVSNQISRPIIIVNIAQTTVMYPLNFNHPRVIGITMAGTVNKNVMKTITAFPMAAVPASVYNHPLSGSMLTNHSTGTYRTTNPLQHCLLLAFLLSQPLSPTRR